MYEMHPALPLKTECDSTADISVLHSVEVVQLYPQAVYPI
jgi:hypothetical protein